MGRKTNKAKDKLVKRKEEKAILEEHAALVESANRQVDPMSSFTAFKKFTKNGLNLDLECKPVGLLDNLTIDILFNLEKENMKTYYEDCSWGWNDKKKRAEMTEESARYLIARDPDGTLVAFSHFRFDLDCGDPVLYWYELDETSPQERVFEEECHFEILSKLNKKLYK